MDVEHLLFNFLGSHTSSEDSDGSEVTTTTWVTGSHHVLVVKDL